MKKFKILSAVVAAVPATVMPLTALANCSCSDIDYTGITKTMKEDVLSYFTTLSSKGSFRQTWDCQEAYDTIKRIMTSLGYTATYADNWSEAAKEDGATLTGTYGNIWYDIPATQGCETWPKIMLSAYYDMSYGDDLTQEQIQEIKNNGIELHTDEEKQIMYNNNSNCSCGFNAGIGVANMLALAKNHKLFSHGPIRLLFTADSMDSTTHYASGADYLRKSQKDLLAGKKPFDTNYVINSDGNSQAEINISSAGIHQCQVNGKQYEPVTIDFANDDVYKTNGGHEYEITVSGLTGGHTASDINNTNANAIKVLFEVLAINNPGFQIVSIETDAGPSAAYRIPKIAKAKIIMSTILNSASEDVTYATLAAKVDSVKETYQHVYLNDKNKINIQISNQSQQPIRTGTRTVCNTTIAKNLIAFVTAIRYGAFVWFDENQQQVKTSSSISPLTLSYDDSSKKYKLNVTVTCRSANANQLEIFSDTTHSFLDSLLGVTKTDYKDIETPVWENSEEVYKTPNKMANILIDAYKRFRYTPKTLNSHGWLEAACFPRIIETMEGSPVPYIATIGPTISDPSTTNEKLYISTLNSYIRAIVYVLHNAQALGK